MKTMKIAAAAIFAAGLSTAAHAAILTETGTVTQAQVDYTSPITVVGGPSTSAFEFPAADGTLTSVVVTFNISGNLNGTLTNTTGSTETFTYQAPTTTVSLNSSASAIAAGVPSLSLSGASASYTIASGASLALNPSPNFAPFHTSETIALNTPAEVAAAESAGGFTLSFATLTGSATSTGTGISSKLSTTVGGSVSVSFNYTPASTGPVTTVPEPSTFAVLGAGLVGLGMIRRRKAG